MYVFAPVYVYTLWLIKLLSYFGHLLFLKCHVALNCYSINICIEMGSEMCHIAVSLIVEGKVTVSTGT